MAAGTFIGRAVRPAIASAGGRKLYRSSKAPTPPLIGPRAILLTLLTWIRRRKPEFCRLNGHVSALNAGFHAPRAEAVTFASRALVAGATGWDSDTLSKHLSSYRVSQWRK